MLSRKALGWFLSMGGGMPQVSSARWATPEMGTLALEPLIGLAKTFSDLHCSPVASLPCSAFLPHLSQAQFCAHIVWVAAPPENLSRHKPWSV